MTVHHPAAKAFLGLVDALTQPHRGLNPDNFEFVARLADGTPVTRAQRNQLVSYGVTTLNDGRVIDRDTPLSA